MFVFISIVDSVFDNFGSFKSCGGGWIGGVGGVGHLVYEIQF